MDTTTGVGEADTTTEMGVTAAALTTGAEEEVDLTATTGGEVDSTTEDMVVEGAVAAAIATRTGERVGLPSCCVRAASPFVLAVSTARPWQETYSPQGKTLCCAT